MTMVLDGLEQWGGVPVASQAATPVPIFGTHYFVDGTNGSDDNPGTNKNEAKETIQAAITLQIAKTTGLGDAIWIMPGTYAETLTGALTKVSLLGVGFNQVIVAPTDSNAYVGAINDSRIAGITFRTPSTSSVTSAALAATDLIGSAIYNCRFQGMTDPVNAGVGTTGIRIGAESEGTWEEMRNSSISFCVFSEGGGRTTELSHGISIGPLATDGISSNYGNRVFRHSIISDNLICAEWKGITLKTGNANNNGGLITRNTIHSMQGGVAGCQSFCIGQMVEADVLCMVTNNRLSSALDCIKNFNTTQVQGNLCSTNGGTPAWESAA